MGVGADHAKFSHCFHSYRLLPHINLMMNSLARSAKRLQGCFHKKDAKQVDAEVEGFVKDARKDTAQRSS